MFYFYFAVWLFCGLGAYGLYKGCSRNLCRSVPDRYSFKDEKIAIALFMAGPLGLLLAAFDNMTLARVGFRLKPWGFCLKIPKELKRKR